MAGGFRFMQVVFPGGMLELYLVGIERFPLVMRAFPVEVDNGFVSRGRVAVDQQGIEGRPKRVAERARSALGRDRHG